MARSEPNTTRFRPGSRTRWPRPDRTRETGNPGARNTAPRASARGPAFFRRRPRRGRSAASPRGTGSDGRLRLQAKVAPAAPMTHRSRRGWRRNRAWIRSRCRTAGWGRSLQARRPLAATPAPVRSKPPPARFRLRWPLPGEPSEATKWPSQACRRALRCDAQDSITHGHQAIRHAFGGRCIEQRFTGYGLRRAPGERAGARTPGYPNRYCGLCAFAASACISAMRCAMIRSISAFRAASGGASCAGLCG